MRPRGLKDLLLLYMPLQPLDHRLQDMPQMLVLEWGAFVDHFQRTLRKFLSGDFDWFDRF